MTFRHHALSPFVALLLLLFPPAAQGETTARRAAVIVGANAAASGRAPLRYSHDDARNLAAVLQEVGGFEVADVSVLLDPDPAEVLATLDRRLTELGAAAHGSLLLFYYSGHADSQSLYPSGKPLAINDLRARLDDARATVRLGILDACRGGGWTRAKGMQPDVPFEVDVPMSLASEGSVLISSSSGLESAHESAALRRSFFTHHLLAGLRGAADQSGDGEVTVGEAFAYAKELTIRDSTLQADAPQHPSFDMNLRGRNDVALTRAASSGTRVDLVQTRGPLQVIQLSTGLVVVEVPTGKRSLTVALPPGRYLVRRRSSAGTFAREVAVEANRRIAVDEDSLEMTGTTTLAAKGADDTPYATATTVRGRHMELTTLAGLAHTSAPALSFSAHNFATTASLTWGLTDRFELSIPLPALAYRFGHRGGWEVIPWGGVFGGGVIDRCDEGVDKDCVSAGYEPMAGVSVRWWLTDRAALNGGLTGAYLGFFKRSERDALFVQGTLGFSFTAYDLLTINLAAALTVPVIEGTLRQTSGFQLSLGSVQNIGVRQLPLFQIHVMPKLSLDAHISLTENLKTKDLTTAFMGGATWTF
ncbi:MAG: caspase family protein [Deltaproteobacteria bacterium]|nr:caspase family protein [Deltaproteobacteria bacterium]